jgi:hypothetical protein
MMSEKTPMIIQLTEEEYAEVLQKVGQMILNLPIASGQLGHSTAASTIRGNYLSSKSDVRTKRVAAEFVNDLFKLKTSEMCTKWYGDPTGAAVRRCMKILA